MKKTENINIGGYAFVIEEEAYQELVGYLDGIKGSLKDDAEEITADIEVRIAELLSEKCKGGSVVTLQVVRQVCERIGNPYDISEDDDTGKPRQGSIRKRLFRNMERRVLGGVCSGIGSYFGLDPVLIRLLFMGMFATGVLCSSGMITGLSLACYCALWIAMPAARTVEDKCRMNGKPIKLENFVSNGAGNYFKQEMDDLGSSPAVRKTGRIVSGVFGGILMVCGLAGLLGCFVIPTIPDIFDKVVNIRDLTYDEPLAIASRIIYTPGFWWMVTAIAALLCIWMLYNGTILCFGFKSPSWKPGLVIFLAWLISILVLAGWTVKIVADMLPVLL